MAQKHWPGRIAVGRLHAVRQGDDVRVCLDGTSSGANPASVILESKRHPGIHDLEACWAAALAECDGGNRAPEQVALKLDVRKAHKRILVEECDRGLTLFMFDSVLRFYLVFTFGLRAASHWWGLQGAALLRLVHHFIYARHTGMLYEDDFLFLLVASVAPL